ncbi:ras-related protein Rab-11B-like [Ruditapes philippinarum]|uniref:ras-related protein Rab-11B-like n=1 Tax=Ruditapes philippinarum TaxID=129788 RepID=UPI00295B6545|nr:ras-related protein Rab-11B-like [Ruditapes philippinarum]
MFNATQADNYDYLYKVVVVGDTETGKSNILSRFTKDEFKEKICATIGVEFGTRTVQVNGKNVKAQVWDTAGQERYMAITSAYYRGAVGAMIIYDVTKRSSFTNVVKWVNEIKENGIENIPIVLVGNKMDLKSKREVPTNEAKEFAERNNLEFIEMSAKTNTNVDKAFEDLLTGIMRKVGKDLDVGNSLSPNEIKATPTGVAEPSKHEEEEKGAELEEEDIPAWAGELFREISEIKEQLKVVDKLENVVETMSNRMDDIEKRVTRLETRKVDFKTAHSKSVKSDK